MSTFGKAGRKARSFNTSNGTHTRDGFEPHLKVKTLDGSIAFEAPVRVNPPIRGEELPRTQYDREGRKLYALPGGLQIAV